MQFDIKHEGRETFRTTREEAEALDYPPSVIEDAIAERRQAAVREECRRRIYEKASAEAQMNMATATATIAAKGASSRAEREKAVLSGVEGALAWVEAMREAYRNMPADANYLDDLSWPEIPDDVLAVVSQF